jgi:hypothetical protein
MTKGEYRVGINFNPSADDAVGQIKRMAADLIDLIDSIPVSPEAMQLGSARAIEVTRLKALALTAIEEGAMWGVKAATKPVWTGWSEVATKPAPETK